MSRMLLTLLARLRQAAPASADQVSDGKLLSRFVRSQDAAAFELLFWRHGPMVWNVCRRLLGDSADAEDAFQAAFVVLARKADTIVHGEALAGFLHRVAWRVALNARTARQRRSAHEQAVPRPADLPDRDDPVGRTMDAEMKELLDQELQRLPEKFRLPLILCDLEEQSHEAAARELCCPLGTLNSRLTRGREKLRERLLRRGVTLTGLAAVAVPSAVSAAALDAVQRVPSDAVRALVEGAMRALAVRVGTKALIGMVTCGLLLTGWAFAAFVGKEEPRALPPARLAAAAQPPAPKEAEPDRTPKPADEITALRKARVALAQKGYEAAVPAVRQTQRVGNVLVQVGKPEEVYRWSVRWLQAERELSPKKADQVAALEAHLKRMTELEKMIKALSLDLLPKQVMLDGEWYRLEAQLWLAEAKAR